MNNQHSFSSMKVVFELLNQHNIKYAVLRNYDNILEDEIYMDGHGDVDLICEDSEALAMVLKAYPHQHHFKKGEHDKVHYYIYVQGNYVSLDLRYVGDGYYYEQWARDILERRVLHQGFYVLNPEDYFYTLVYHAVFQKKEFTEEYRQRLIKMAKELNIQVQFDNSQGFVSILEEHMRNNKYFYVYPNDRYVPLKRKHIQDKGLFKMNAKYYFQHLIFETKLVIIDQLVKIKHIVLGKK